MWFAGAPRAIEGDFTASHAQAFGEGTTDVLRKLTVAIVGMLWNWQSGCRTTSTTGSVKRLILVDDDVVEDRNINRILHTTRNHAEHGTPKVDAVADGIRRIAYRHRCYSDLRKFGKPYAAVEAVASADVICSVVWIRSKAVTS